MPLASATTYITFSPLNLGTEDIQVFNSTGSLIGAYNTSSQLIPLTDNQSYVFLVIPSNSNLLGNHPDTWFSNFVSFCQEHAIALTVIFFIIAMLITAVRRM